MQCGREYPLMLKPRFFSLGDNLYKHGLPDAQYKENMPRPCGTRQPAFRSRRHSFKVYMIPGNHDWQNGSRGGYDAIIRQQLYVDFLGKKNVKYHPEDGCPGPVEVPIGTDIVLILFDSQWWLHPHEKPEIEPTASARQRKNWWPDCRHSCPQCKSSYW